MVRPITPAELSTERRSQLSALPDDVLQAVNDEIREKLGHTNEVGEVLAVDVARRVAEFRCCKLRDVVPEGWLEGIPTAYSAVGWSVTPIVDESDFVKKYSQVVGWFFCCQEMR